MSENNRHSAHCNKLCRTCLAKDKVLRSVFDIYLGNIKFNIVIEEATGILIVDGKESSFEICDECKEKATTAFEFKKKSLECNEYFKGMEHSCVLRAEKKTDVVVDSEDENLAVIKLKKYKNNESNDSDHESSDVTSNNNSAMLEDEINVGLSCILCHSNFINEEMLSKHTCKKIKAKRKTKDEPKKKDKIKSKKKTGTITKAKSKLKNSASANSKKLSCGICQKKILTKQQFVDHLTNHKAMTIHSCILCKSMYLNKSKAENHLCPEITIKGDDKKVDENDGDHKNKPQEKMNFITDICLGSLIETEDTSEEVECLKLIQVCSICTAMFLSTDGLLDHIDNVHLETSRRCNICKKMLSSVKSAIRHRVICKKIYKCTTCHQAFPYETTLNKHIISAHKGQVVSTKFLETPNYDKEFKCNICKKLYHRQDLLDKHSQIHEPGAIKYACDVCNKQYLRPDSLKTHLLTHEPEDKLPSDVCLCLYCGRRFANSSNLVVHMRRHTGEKPYKCDFCDKGFPRSTDLLYHRRSHTGEKPCICNVCGKAFARNNKLARHMRVHTGDRPYRCKYCEKAFTQSNDLKLHVRRHTGDKPYVCEMCGDRFIQGTALQSHRRHYGHFPTTKGKL